MVAPFAGAWIEIALELAYPFNYLVAPFAGAWIEISSGWLSLTWLSSLPSRERGLKYQEDLNILLRLFRRSLRGSVD